MARRSKLAQAAAETVVGCVLTCFENAKIVIALALVLSALSIGGAVMFLSVNTDTARMIDRELPFRERFDQLLTAFPQLGDTVVAVIEAEQPARATAAARALARAFRDRPDLFSDVYAPDIDPFFEVNGLLYKDRSEVQQAVGRLQGSIPMLKPLAQDPTLRGLSQFLQIIAYSIRQGQDPSGFNPVVAEVERVVAAHAAGGRAEMDWSGVLIAEGAAEGQVTRKFVVVRPLLDYSSLTPAEQSLDEARRIIKDPDVTLDDDVRIRLTGETVVGAEELRSVADSAVFASIVSLVLVSLVLTFGIRSWRLVTAALLTLVIGLSWTAGVATLTVGYLNLISVAFAVMFVGLGIDFAIHFCLRYEEEVRRGMPQPIAFANTADGIGGALAVCTGAAAVGFLAFTPTSFVGMAQLGIISAAGMVIAFLTSITVLPAFLSLMPLPGPQTPVKPRSSVAVRMPDWRKPAVLATLAVCAVSVFFWPQVRFDGDPINLKDPNTESVKTFLELFERDSTSPYTAQILVEGDDEAKQLVSELTALPEVSRVITIFSFLPDGQEEKLPQIRQARAAMGEVPTQASAEIDEGGRAEALQTMIATLGRLSAVDDKSFSQAASGLEEAVAEFVEQHGSDTDRVRALEQSLFRNLAPTIERIKRSLSAGEVSIANLPPNIRDRYVSQNGVLRLEVFPSRNISDQDAMRAFTDAVLRVAPQTTGSPVEVTGAADVVVEAMLQATAIAGILIAIVLFLSLRRIVDVVLVLIPIALASSLTVAATVWLDTPFNFANVIVLPLLIGLGVAGGVHLVVRSRVSRPDVGLFDTNTPRAVLLSALTTIGSFASLGTSSHRGMASMGILLTISIISTLICTLIVLPQLIRWWTGKTESGKDARA